MQALFQRFCRRVGRISLFRSWREQREHRDWRKWTNELRNALAEGAHSEVRERVEITLKRWPHNLHAQIMAIDVARCLGDHQASLRCSQRLIDSHPDQGLGYAAAAETLIVLGRVEEAVEIVKRGTKKVQNSPDILEAAASVFRAAGQHKDSIQAACQRMMLEPKWSFKASRFQFLNLKELMTKSSDAKDNSRLSSSIDFIFNSHFVLSSAEIPFNFIYAPKNACSTIKNTLLPLAELSSSIHTDVSLCLNAEINPFKEFIILTRHPIHRFLSAYMDKLNRTKGKESGVWKRMVRRYNLQWNQQPSIDALLDILLTDDPNLIDPHFRPQTLVFSNKLVKPARIFRMERLSELLAYLSNSGFPTRTYSKHSSKAKLNAAKPELTTTAIQKLIQLYGEDFDVYQYPLDPSCPDSPPTVVQQQQLDPFFESILRSEYQGTNKDVGPIDPTDVAKLLSTPQYRKSDVSSEDLLKIGLKYRARKSY